MWPKSVRLKAFDGVQLVAVRMADGIDSGLSVERDGVDDQRVAVPVAHGIAEPGGVGVLRMRTPVDRRDVKPAVLLVEHRDIFIVLHDLNGMRTADGA